MKSFLAATLGLACSLLPLIAPSAEPPADNRALELKEAEVIRLRDELNHQERELQRLRRENEALRKAKDTPSPSPRPLTPPAVPNQPAAPPPEPSQPIQQVAQPSWDDTLETSDLVAYFASEPDLAAAKFVNQKFLIRGQAGRLETALLQRRFWVEFSSPAPSRQVRALVVFPASWNAVFAARDMSKLVERSDLANRTILQVGEPILLRARCQGLRGNEIRFDRGELLPLPNP